MCVCLATIYEEPAAVIVTDRRRRLELVKRARRHGKQLTIGIKASQMASQTASQMASQTAMASRYYRNLDTIFEEENKTRDWPKMQYSIRRSYEFPSVAIQLTTGHGKNCAYCSGDFVHRYHFSKSPVYLKNCGHIICGHCVSLNSRPIVRNLSPFTRKKIPYIAASGGMACPTCNVEFTWQEIHNFYI